MSLTTNERKDKKCINLFILITNPTPGTIYTLPSGLTEIPAIVGLPSTSVANLVDISSTALDYKILSQTSVVRPLSGILSGWVVDTPYSSVEAKVTIYLALSSANPSNISLYINNPSAALSFNSFPSLIFKFNSNAGNDPCNPCNDCESHFFFYTANAGIIANHSIIIPYPPTVSVTELRSLYKRQQATCPQRGTKFKIYNITIQGLSFPESVPTTKASSYLGSVYLSVINANGQLTLIAKSADGCNIVYPSSALFVEDDETIQSATFGATPFIA
jgi:hypothetical protein